MAQVDPLASARAKIGRAREHLVSMRDATTAFLATEPYMIAHDVDVQQTEHVFRFHTLREPPDMLSLIAGDVIHNTRAALDHMVFAFAHHKTPTLTKQESRGLQFPICDHPNAFVEEVKRGRLIGIQDQAFIEAMQPYATHDRSLADLRSLSNIDKHRRLHLLFFQTEQAWYRSPIAVLGTRADADWNRAPLVDGAPVLRLSLPSPCPERDVYLEGLKIGIGCEPTGGQPITKTRNQERSSIETTLAHILAYIESGVRDEFARRL